VLFQPKVCARPELQVATGVSFDLSIFVGDRDVSHAVLSAFWSPGVRMAADSGGVRALHFGTQSRCCILLTQFLVSFGVHGAKSEAVVHMLRRFVRPCFELPFGL